MGFFDKRRPQRLPREIVAMMERFGRHEIDPMRSTDDGYLVFQATQEPLLDVARADPAGFVRSLVDACVPVGGWAIYGADRTVINLVTDPSVASSSTVPPPDSDWARILEGSLAFLRANYVPPLRVASYQWDYFLAHGGTPNTWLEMRPPPRRAEARLTPLAPGEVRPVIKTAPEPDANIILVRRDGDQHVADVDARWSDDDPTRSRSELARAVTQYDLYLDLAYQVQVWHSLDPEIEPFFPTPRALI